MGKRRNTYGAQEFFTLEKAKLLTLKHSLALKTAKQWRASPFCLEEKLDAERETQEI